MRINLCRGVHNAERRAVEAGRQASSIAVREHPGAFWQKLGPMRADCAVGALVFFLHGDDQLVQPFVSIGH